MKEERKATICGRSLPKETYFYPSIWNKAKLKKIFQNHKTIKNIWKLKHFKMKIFQTEFSFHLQIHFEEWYRKVGWTAVNFNFAEWKCAINLWGNKFYQNNSSPHYKFLKKWKICYFDEKITWGFSNQLWIF